MRSIIAFLVMGIFLVSFVSADLAITQQPNDVYNLGDKLDVNVKVSSAEGVYDYLQVSLICDSSQKILPKEEIGIGPNEETNVQKSIILIKKFIGNAVGKCKIKASLDDHPNDYIFSNEFQISDSLNVTGNLSKLQFNPGENGVLKGKVTKIDGNPVNGFVNLTFVSDNSSNTKSYSGSVNNGDFSVGFGIPSDAESGKYLIKLDVYEKGPLGEITNKGTTNYNIEVNQIPTSLEVLFKNSKVNPGDNLSVKSVLHDQTGKKIDSTVVLTLKDDRGHILKQVESSTDTFMGFQIPKNELPSNWTIVAFSQKITSQAEFSIAVKKDVSAKIVNGTLIVENTGNVPYNGSLIVKVGDNAETINPNLPVRGIKRYSLEAPNGEYSVEVLANGETKITGNVALTGNSIKVKELSSIGILSAYPLAWVFVFFVLAVIAYIVYRRGLNKTFFGRQGKMKDVQINEKSAPSVFSKKGGLSLNPGNKAVLSLSMTGDKQASSIVCLKLKNYDELKNKTESTGDTLGKIISFAEERNAYIYESGGEIFFILAPSVTRTFNNQMNAIEIAKKSTEILIGHNKLFRQKIDFGISVTYGDLIAKKEKTGVLRFMALGNVMNNLKKISGLSDGEIYVSQKMKDKLMSKVKTQKVQKGGVEVYAIKEIKGEGEGHKKFLSEFIRRLERDGDREDKKEE